MNVYKKFGSDCRRGITLSHIAVELSEDVIERHAGHLLVGVVVDVFGEVVVEQLPNQLPEGSKLGLSSSRLL